VRYLGDFLLALWLTFVMPIWGFMMLWGQRVFVTPYFVDGTGVYMLLLAAMYLPLLVFALTRTSSEKPSTTRNEIKRMLSFRTGRRA
jgi:hypothetical protein